MIKISKIVFLYIFCCSAIYSQEVHIPETAVLLDGIDAVVFSQHGTEVVTKSDIVRPSLSGEKRTRDDLIFERLVYLDAQKFKMLVPDEEAIDKYLANVQREQNLTEDDLKNIFTQAGYTYQEGRDQFKRMYTVSSMLEFKIRQNVIVPRSQVEAYFQQHPEYEKEAYQIQTGFLPYDERDRLEQKKDIFRKNSNQNIDWNKPFWIEREDIAEDKNFIFAMKPNDVKIDEKEDGFEFFKLVSKKDERLIPLEERYSQIADILKRPKHDELMEKYKQNLYDTISVLYF